MKEIIKEQSSLWYATLIMLAFFCLEAIGIFIFKLDFKFLIPCIVTIITQCIVFLVVIGSAEKKISEGKNPIALTLVSNLYFAILIFGFAYINLQMMYVAAITLIVYRKLFFWLLSRETSA